jgi:putative ABC transport system permease protein
MQKSDHSPTTPVTRRAVAPRYSIPRALRSLTGASGMIVRRRARRDAGLLVAWVLLVAFAMALAVATPRFVLGTLDSAAREAVTAAGSSADLIITSSVAEPRVSASVPVMSVPDLLQLARNVPGALPAALHRVAKDTTVSLVGSSTQARTIDGVTQRTGSAPSVRLGMLTPTNRALVTVIEGSLPATTATRGEPIEIAISEATARTTRLRVGSELSVPVSPTADVALPGNTVALKVTGIVARSGGRWNQLGEVWDPTVLAGGASSITVLASPEGMTEASRSYQDPFSGTISVRLDPNKFTSALLASVAAESQGLQVNPAALVAGTSFTIEARSEFATALGNFPAQSRASLAQMLMMVAGLLGVAAAVLLLVARLLALRRAGEVALERARGATLASIALRALIESLATGLVGAALGAVVGLMLQPGPIVSMVPVIAVLAAAILAAPAQAVLSTRGLWAGRRAPANRRDRQQLVANANSRRIAVEVTLIALAAAAVVSLATRGLLQTSTDQVDPLLAAAPLLFAIAVTVVVLRLYRWPVRLFGRIARRSRGAMGLVSAVRAEKSVAVLPLLSLSLAVAITVMGGLLTETVLSGQVDASWSRIGADARVHGRVVSGQPERVAAAPGVSAAASDRVIPQVQLSLGTTGELVTILAIDKYYPHLVDTLPRTQADSGVGATEGARSLGRLATTDNTTSDAIPIVVDDELARIIVTKDLSATIEGEDFPLKVVGTTHLRGPVGYLSGPFVYVDLVMLSERTPKPILANTLLAVGPGSAAAVATQGFTSTQVDDRATWLDARRHQALVNGVQLTVLLATAAVALLALIALLATVVASSRDRVRSVSLLRTLGAPPRVGWWLALAELAPTVLGALVSGVASAVTLVVVLTPALGLQNLTGGMGPPRATVSPILIVGLLGATVGSLLLAALAEVVLHRRDRLSDVLRVGETV